MHILACIVLAIVVIKPHSTENWLTSIFLVSPIMWFVFVGPKFIDRWQAQSRYSFTGWITLALKLLLFFWVIKVAEPFTASVLAELLNA